MISYRSLLYSTTVLYDREDFEYPHSKHLPYYIGRILCTPRKTSRKKARIEERTDDVPNPNHQYTGEKPLLLDVQVIVERLQ